MIHGKRVVVVLPAYNASKTLQRTHEELPHEIVDRVILVDDASQDETSDLARRLGITTFVHSQNLGYGGNQKTCYREALRAGADVVIMVHPDYQYTPALVTAMASMVGKGIYDAVLGSRMLGKSALKGGMPRYKYVANRILTLIENVALQRKLSEYHTGYRAFSRQVLETLPLEENSDDFVFDNEMLAQIVAFGYSIGEVSCPTRYFGEASSISFTRSVHYGLGVLGVCVKFRLHMWGLRRSPLFDREGRKLGVDLPTVASPAAPPRADG
ncbi:MAG: glycosyltransferase family 2 protein [Candidatus Eisenbacteria bacterium]|uniref:Glycosyltransferase family 2 protein n=1 Tax=Eiseniibacteriota bacterium TaxID=2212470 RepID=A0A538T9B8_UNCEI|nr:MAG: glycosyltransferase family 2 protein [Candidatus Eisenbacteria bacterium]